jgi:hypothetical protein
MSIVSEMEMQTPKDSSGLVFVVTDLLRGVRYFIAERDSCYEIEVPRKAGYAKVAVSKEADVIEVADRLIRLLDNADHVRFNPCASAESSSSLERPSRSTMAVQVTTHTAQTVDRKGNAENITPDTLHR